MRLSPSRRWFQFRLSTWFVLVAILGWAFAVRPVVVFDYHTAILGDPVDHRPRFWIGINWGMGARYDFKTLEFGPIPDLLWPVLALAAFLAWKAACAVVERRRRSLPATWRETHSHSPRSGGRA